MCQRLLQLLLFLVFMGLLPVGCCNAPTLDYLSLKAIAFNLIEARPGGGRYVENGRTTTAKLRISTQVQADLVAVVPLGFPSFVSQSIASSACDSEYGGKGLKDQAKTVAFTSRQLFNGIAPGQSLNQFVRCVGYGKSVSENDTVAVPLSQLADSINVWANKRGSAQFSLYLSPKPRDNPRQQFELRITLASGKEISQTTPEIIWE